MPKVTQLEWRDWDLNWDSASWTAESEPFPLPSPTPQHMEARGKHAKVTDYRPALRQEAKLGEADPHTAHPTPVYQASPGLLPALTPAGGGLSKSPLLMF